MKKSALLGLSLTLSMLISNQVHAMGRALPDITNQNLEKVEVSQNLQLRATDGSIISLLSDANRGLQLRTVLPAEKNADHSLCGQNSLKSITLQVDLIQIAASRAQTPSPLTAQEIALIAKTPRCEPFLASLNLLAQGFQKAQGNVAESVKSLSLKVDKNTRQASLLLNTESGKSAAFILPTDVKAVSDAYELTSVKIAASQSGQNLGIRFELDSMESGDPSYSRDYESCTTRHGHSGTRRVRSRMQSTFYKLTMIVSDTNNHAVLTAKLNDVDLDFDRDPGECRGGY